MSEEEKLAALEAQLDREEDDSLETQLDKEQDDPDYLRTARKAVDMGGLLSSFGMGVVDSATLGHTDEIVGGAAAMLNPSNVEDIGHPSKSKAYKEWRDKTRDVQASAQANDTGYIPGMFLGGSVLSMVPGLNVAQGVKGLPLMLNAAKSGAIVGGLTGAGQAKEAEDIVPEMVGGGVGGAIIGGGLTSLGTLGSRMAKGLYRTSPYTQDIVKKFKKGMEGIDLTPGAVEGHNKEIVEFAKDATESFADTRSGAGQAIPDTLRTADANMVATQAGPENVKNLSKMMRNTEPQLELALEPGQYSLSPDMPNVKPILEKQVRNINARLYKGNFNEEVREQLLFERDALLRELKQLGHTWGPDAEAIGKQSEKVWQTTKGFTDKLGLKNEKDVEAVKNMVEHQMQQDLTRARAAGADVKDLGSTVFIDPKNGKQVLRKKVSQTVAEEEMLTVDDIKKHFTTKDAGLLDTDPEIYTHIANGDFGEPLQKSYMEAVAAAAKEKNSMRSMRGTPPLPDEAGSVSLPKQTRTSHIQKNVIATEFGNVEIVTLPSGRKALQATDKNTGKLIQQMLPEDPIYTPVVGKEGSKKGPDTLPMSNYDLWQRRNEARDKGWTQDRAELRTGIPQMHNEMAGEMTEKLKPITGKQDAIYSGMTNLLKNVLGIDPKKLVNRDAVVTEMTKKMTAIFKGQADPGQIAAIEQFISTLEQTDPILAAELIPQFKRLAEKTGLIDFSKGNNAVDFIQPSMLGSISNKVGQGLRGTKNWANEHTGGAAGVIGNAAVKTGDVLLNAPQKSAQLMSKIFPSLEGPANSAHVKARGLINTIIQDDQIKSRETVDLGTTNLTKSAQNNIMSASNISSENLQRIAGELKRTLPMSPLKSSTGDVAARETIASELDKASKDPDKIKQGRLWNLVTNPAYKKIIEQDPSLKEALGHLYKPTDSEEEPKVPISHRPYK